MSLAMGNFELFGGSLMLFLTNVVFIVLGTALVFWSVGIDTRPQKSNSKSQKQYVWTRYWFAAFVLLSTLLAIYMAAGFSHPFETDKHEIERQFEQTQIESSVES